MLPVLCVLTSAGCTAHTGLRVGDELGDNPHRLAWGAEAGGALSFASEGLAPYLGASLESVAIHDVGGLAFANLSAGAVLIPAPDRVGVLATIDGGIPLGWSVAQDGYQLGGTLGMPLSLDSERRDSARNRNLMLIGRRVELVPFLRYRFRALDPEGKGAPRQYHALSFGMLLQARLFSELL